MADGSMLKEVLAIINPPDFVKRSCFGKIMRPCSITSSNIPRTASFGKELVALLLFLKLRVLILPFMSAKGAYTPFMSTWYGTRGSVGAAFLCR